MAFSGGGSRKRKKARAEAAFRKSSGSASQLAFKRTMARLTSPSRYGATSTFIDSVEAAKAAIRTGSCSAAYKLINHADADISRFKTNAQKKTASRILSRVDELYIRKCETNDDDDIYS